MHKMVNIPKHGQKRTEVRAVFNDGELELRVFDKTNQLDNGFRTGANLQLQYLTEGMASEKRLQLMDEIGQALCFVLTKGQEVGYQQAKEELRKWLLEPKETWV